MNDGAAPEFSYLLPVDSIGNAAKRIRLEADAASRAALARRFDLLSVDKLAADLTVSRIADSALVRVSGQIAADIVQTCVVSQEPAPAQIHETISERFGPGEPGDRETVVDYDAEDPPEPFVEGAIELGELLAQYLAMCIDPYPRRPHAEAAVPNDAARNDGTAQKNNPFQSLSELRKNLA